MEPFPFPSLVQSILSCWESVSHIKGGFVRNWVTWKSKSGSRKIRFEIGGNRWCMNKHRAHKSNHILFIVDLHQSCFYQRCYDSDCQSYISPPFPISPQESDVVSSYFDAESLIE